MNHKFFVNIQKSEVQAELWMILVHRVAISDNPKEARQLRKALRKINLEASLIVSQIEKLDLIPKSSSLKQARAKKKVKLNDDNGADMDIVWRKLGLILELVTVMNGLGKAWLLIHPLCQCLKTSFSYETATIELVQQQILTALHHLIELSFSELSKDSWNEIKLNIECIVQCIRSTVNPDTQRRALLVLSYGAKLDPQIVLHNIMTIFTFMGTSLLRRDDAYSFQAST